MRLCRGLQLLLATPTPLWRSYQQPFSPLATFFRMVQEIGCFEMSSYSIPGYSVASTVSNFLHRTIESSRDWYFSADPIFSSSLLPTNLELLQVKTPYFCRRVFAMHAYLFIEVHNLNFLLFFLEMLNVLAVRCVPRCPLSYYWVGRTLYDFWSGYLQRCHWHL